MPLKPTLPGSVIPYMVPFLLTEPKRTFPALKYAGVPMYRWEDVGESDCPIAKEYRETLIQLPCHETLTAEELDFIRVTVTKVLRET